MSRLLKHLKAALLAWGAISLGAVIALIGWLALEYSFRTVPPPRQSTVDVAPMLDKRYGDVQLTIREDEGPAPRLTLVKAGRSLVTAYQLPTSHEGADWFSDARIYPAGGDAYRIALFGTYGDGHTPGGRILLLKFDGQMHLVQHLPIGDVQDVNSTGTKLFGTVHVFFPGIDGSDPFLTADVPTLLSIGEEVRVTPMLDAEAIKLFRTHYGKMVEKRLARLSGSERAEIVERLKKAQTDLQDALLPKRFPY